MEEQFVPEEVLEELKAVFFRFDKFSEGKMNSRDLRHAMAVLGLGPTEAELLDLMESISVEDRITLDSFIAGVSPWIKTYTEEQLLEAFRIFDKEGTEYITASQLKQVMTYLGRTTVDEDIEFMIKEADLDGDGKVNFEEFCALMNVN